MSFGFSPFSGSSPILGDNGNFSQKGCFGLGVLIGAGVGAGMALWIKKRSRQLPIPKGMQERLDQAFSQNNLLGLIPESAVSPVPQITDPQPITQIVDITKEPYLLFEKYIHKGEIAAIVAPAGNGKTFTATETVKHPSLKKVVIFLPDDSGSRQLARFDGIPSIKVITREIWDQYLIALQDAFINNITFQALSQTILGGLIKSLTIFEQFKNKRKRLLAEAGINESKKVDALLLWEFFMESDMCRAADAIILDCLNALLDNSGQITRHNLERIIGFCTKNQKTLIILHHTNKKGEVAGNSAFKEVMDTVLMLEKEGDILRIDVAKSRYSPDAKGCFVRMIEAGPHSVRFEQCDKPPRSSAPELPPLEGAILKVIGDAATIEFADLLSGLKSEGIFHDGSVKNALKQLERRGYLVKADGSSWSLIRNCKSEALEDTAETDVIVPCGLESTPMPVAEA